MDDLQRKADEAEDADDLRTALYLWKELASKASDPFFFVRWGRVAQKLDRWEEAESAFTEALNLDPASSLIMTNIGDLWATRTDKDDSESLRTAEQWFLKSLKHDRNACVLTLLGSTYLALDDSEAARIAFEEAVRIDPNYEEAIYNLAVLGEETNLDASIELLERAIQIDPNYAIAHQALGRLHQKVKDLVRAEYHFERSLEIDPSNYWSNLYMANLLGVLGRNSEAEEAYRFTTNLHPEIPSGIEFFARFLESIGKNQEAAIERARIKPQAG
jgi:tetratricopeptide (TPR) repeat protein